LISLEQRKGAALTPDSALLLPKFPSAAAFRLAGFCFVHIAFAAFAELFKFVIKEYC
jgi:hypothetical protein